jgi:hypothetical protein
MKLETLLNGAVALLVIGGCAAPAPNVDRQFGTAVNTAKAQQTLNPDASRNTDPVAGIDGTAADSALDEYHNSFKAPPPTFPVINVGVGGGGR